MTFKYGDFGKASKKITEMSGEKNYTVEVRLEAMGREFVDHGVLLEGFFLFSSSFSFFSSKVFLSFLLLFFLLEGGTKFILETMVGISILEWIDEEEAERLANDGDPLDAPTSP